MINKKAQGLPINVIVMMIIGLVLFGIGMALFTDIAGSGEDTIEDFRSFPALAARIDRLARMP